MDIKQNIKQFFNARLIGLRNFIKSPKKIMKFLGYGFLCLVLFATVGDFLSTQLREHETIVVSINKGDSLKTISQTLTEKTILSSARVFETLIRVTHLESRIKSGDYEFYKNMSMFSLIKRLINGEFGEQLRVTIPEGFTRFQIAERIKKSNTRFNEQHFLELTEKLEGKLYPDTYYFIRFLTEEKIVARMTDNYEEHVLRFKDDFLKSTHTETEILTMASIIEREAKGRSDAFIISGILWNRISKGIKLQVDAPFYYILKKGSSQLTKTDLRDDHAFNTYVNEGLPPAPISNPGIRSIDAALHPQKTNYLFYLHDRKGRIHTAMTYKEHMVNRDRYIGRKGSSLK